MIDQIKEKWADEGAAFSDDAGLLVQAIEGMAQSTIEAVSSLEAVIGKIELPKSDPKVAANIKALIAKMNKPPVVNLAAPDFSDLRAYIADIMRQQTRTLKTIEALIRILNEPKKTTLKEFAVEVDRNSTTQKIQSMIIKQTR